MARNPNRYHEVVAPIDSALKTLVYEALKEADISVADFLRSALVHFVERGTVPFEIHKARKEGLVYTPRQKELTLA